MIRRTVLVAAAALAVAASSAHGDEPHPEAAHTIVLASETVPEGVEIAREYMEARGIPERNLLLVKAPAKEVITRDEFNDTLWNPLRKFLYRWEGRMSIILPDGTLRVRTARRWAKYLVPVYGVPIKIRGYEDVETMYQSHAAAVDSELVLAPTGTHELKGALNNPYFGNRAPFGPRLARAMILVSRLDGPSPEIVRRLIRDAVWAEEQGGLKGRAYVDTRSITEGGYAKGDRWLLNAARSLKKAGLKVNVDKKPEVMHLEYPMPDPGVYVGWYTKDAVGPMVGEKFTFNRGAVAYHLQSFSGAAIRDAKSHWVGPLLAHGACVTAGAVYEPFLSGTPHIDILIDRLLRGHSWGEAAYMSQAMISWQMCFVGDPLYRPWPKQGASRQR